MTAPVERPRRRGSRVAHRTAMFWLGVIGIVFVTGVWLLTNRIEPYLIGAFLALMGIGEGRDALREFQRSRDGDE